MPLHVVKARSICHVYTEIHCVTYNRHIHEDVKEAESEDGETEGVCSRELLTSLNAENQFQT